MSFDPTEWKDLARACRGMAVRLEKDAKLQEGTTIHDQALREVERFREYAERCEQQAKVSSASAPNTQLSSANPAPRPVSRPAIASARSVPTSACVQKP